MTDSEAELRREITAAYRKTVGSPIFPPTLEAIMLVIATHTKTVERAARLDELDHLSDLSYHTTPSGGLVIDIDDINNRIAALQTNQPTRNKESHNSVSGAKQPGKEL